MGTTKAKTSSLLQLGIVLRYNRTYVEGEILLLSGILALDLVRHLSSEKLSKSTVVILRAFQPLSGESDNWLTLLGYNPVAISQVAQHDMTVFQHAGLHEDFLLLSGMFLHESRIVSLGPRHCGIVRMAEQLTDRICVQLQPVANSAECVSYLVVCSLEILYGEVESCQGCHLAMSYCIQVRGGHHVRKRIVISLYVERLVL